MVYGEPRELHSQCRDLRVVNLRERHDHERWGKKEPTAMLNRTSVDNDTPLEISCMWGDVHNTSPKPLLIAPEILSDALTLPADVHFVHSRILPVHSDGLHVRRDRRLFTRKQQFVHDVWMLAVSVRHVPEHAKHSPDAARTEDLHAWRVRVWRVWGSAGNSGLGDAEDSAEEGKCAHTMVSWRKCRSELRILLDAASDLFMCYHGGRRCAYICTLQPCEWPYKNLTLHITAARDGTRVVEYMRRAHVCKSLQHTLYTSHLKALQYSSFLRRREDTAGE